MRVGIVNNSTSAYKQNITFEKSLPYDETMMILKQANRAVNKGESNPNKLKKVLRNTLKLLNESELGSRALFELKFTNNKSVYTKNLRSGNLEKQTKTIDTVYSIMDKSKTVDDYFWKTLIPHIKNSKNENLTEHVLKITQRDMETRTVSSISNRVRILNELGSTKHIEELKSYTGEQKGIHDFQIKECPSYVEEIATKATAAIEKISAAAKA